MNEHRKWPQASRNCFTQRSAPLPASRGSDEEEDQEAECGGTAPIHEKDVCEVPAVVLWYSEEVDDGGAVPGHEGWFKAAQPQRHLAIEARGGFLSNLPTETHPKDCTICK